jgi:hypothetical protein
LASVIASGTTAVCSYAHSVPVLPIPHWISSNTSAAPTASQASRAARSSSSGSGHTPVSPCTGSSSTAAVPSPTASRTAPGSFGSTTKPGTRGANGACLDSCGVADSAPYVRPWNAPSKTTISPPGRALRTSLMAASTASAPELVKNTFPPSERCESRAASRMPGSV